MGAVYGSRADVQRGGLDLGYAQPVQAGDDSRDIDDGVQAAYFVQAHIIDFGTMDLGFGFGEALKNTAGRCFRLWRQRTVLDDGENVTQMGVRMGVCVPGVVRLAMDVHVLFPGWCHQL